VIGDRKISWSWEPLAPGADSLGIDPFFQGNTVIELNSTTSVPERLRIIRANQIATRFYGLGDDNRIRIYDTAGNTLKALDAPSSRILDMDIREVDYASNSILILAGLEDGQIAIWDLRLGTAPEYSQAQTGACRQARFLVLSTSMDERRLVTGGDDGTTRVWLAPGAIRFTMSTAGNADSSLAITQNAFFMAIGDPHGTIRIFEPLKANTILQALNGHQAAVTRLVFSRDTKTLISADATGKVIIWSTKDWSQIAQIQLDTQASPAIGVRDPDAALLYTVESSGLLRVFDGHDGRSYNQRQILSGSTIASVTFGNQGRETIVAQNDRSILTWRTGFCVASVSDPSCFGGYKIWRSPTPRAEDAVLQRIFGFGDSTWTFVENRREFVDPDSMIERGAQPIDENHPLEPPAGPHNGIPYYYSITSFAVRYLSGSTFDIVGDDLQSKFDGFYRKDPNGPPTPVSAHGPAQPEKPYLSSVIVVPNPYELGKVPWDIGSGEHIEFRNLPAQATIQIYSMGGDLLRTIEHGQGEFGESSDVQVWDLKNASGRMVSSGVYIYHIKTKLNRETVDGFFTIIR
jgi:WD40 repeat protein